jgi:hypothetical protein
MTLILSQVIQMLMGVLGVFVLCWAPILISDIADTFGGDSLPGVSRQSMVLADRILQCFSFANSCMNPLLYAFLST